LPSVSEPASVEEAAAVLAAAHAEGARVSIEREGGDLLLSTARLDRILEHEAGDLTCVAETGVRLSSLNAALALHGQVLPLDPPGDPTLGACLAGALSGPLRHRYGTMRDLVIGVTVVLADGTVASSGGKVVKNVAGYDLGKLFHGSRGTLGLIVRLALRLYPLPESARTLVTPAPDAQAAQRLAQALLRSTAAPSALDLLWDGSTGRLAVLLEGSERAVGERADSVASLVGAEPADGDVWAESRERQASSRGVVAFGPGELGERLPYLGRSVVRVGAGVAHVAHRASLPVPEALARVEARVRAEFDRAGALVP
jgi:glycolate oxidase FAD binding subunit